MSGLAVKTFDPKASLYDEDFVLWTEREAAFLRARNWTEIDVENLAEEVEGLGRAERRALESQVTRLLKHLLKWRFQPARHSRSWAASIANARNTVNRDLKVSPSLRRHADAIFDKLHAGARRAAAAETGLPEGTFPVRPIWTRAPVLDAGF